MLEGLRGMFSFDTKKEELWFWQHSLCEWIPNVCFAMYYRDEADVLGDRIAIMKSGYVKTSGSSFFLKKRSVN